MNPFAAASDRQESAPATPTEIAFAALPGLCAAGMRLDRVQVRWVDLREADLVGMEARDSLWEHVQLRRADLRGANLTAAVLRDCNLEGARLDGADLSETRLLRCAFDDASLNRCLLAGATTVGCTFDGTHLHGARSFASSRDIVVEILRRGVDADMELLKIVGAVALRRNWCYEEWAEWLSEGLQRKAVEIFRDFPDAGFAEALLGDGGSEPPSEQTHRNAL